MESYSVQPFETGLFSTQRNSLKIQTSGTQQKLLHL